MPTMTTIYPLHIPMILQFLGFFALAIIFYRYIWHHLYICYFWMESMWGSHWRCCPCFALLLNSLIGNNGFLWNFKYKSCAYHFCLLIMSSFFFFFSGLFRSHTIMVAAAFCSYFNGKAHICSICQLIRLSTSQTRTL